VFSIGEGTVVSGFGLMNRGQSLRSWVEGTADSAFPCVNLEVVMI